MGRGLVCFVLSQESSFRHSPLPVQKLEMKTESIETEGDSIPHPQPLSTDKVLQETLSVSVEERHVMNVHASGDASHTAGDEVAASAESTPADPHAVKGKEVTEAAKEERGEEADKPVPEQEQPATGSQEEEQVSAVHPSEALEQRAHIEVNRSSLTHTWYPEI